MSTGPESFRRVAVFVPLDTLTSDAGARRHQPDARRLGSAAGRWIQDQVKEIRRAGVEVELFGFPPGRGNYVPATRRLRRLLRDKKLDLVHAHYGLAGVVRPVGRRQPARSQLSRN